MNPILAVGSVAFDSIKTPFGEANRVVGGAATYFAIAASFFTEVRIVAVVGDDFGANVEKVFGGRTIDLAGLEKVPGETFRWKGEYGFDLNSRETIYTHLNVFEKFTPKIPPGARWCRPACRRAADRRSTGYGRASCDRTRGRP